MAHDAGPMRMCSCCREAIERLDSLTLNGMFAHVKCVEMAMLEPWSMQQVTDDQLRAECVRRGMHWEPRDISDETLRAECERRGIAPDYEGMSPKYWHDVAADEAWRLKCFTDDRKLLTKDRDAARAERDALKAEARHEWEKGYACGESDMREKWAKFNLREAMQATESGPGIAKLDTRPDNSIAHLDEDLLADDA